MFKTSLNITVKAITAVFAGVCLLQSCSNELPDIVKNDAPVEDGALSSLRDENEAVKIALDGYTRFYQNDNPSSRSQSDMILPKEIIKINKANSRSLDAGENSTMLYIVNFENDMGYAIVSALKNGEPLLAISDSGNYNEEMARQIPGLGQWMESALLYVEANDSISTHSSIEPGTTITPGDKLLQTKSWNDTISHSIVKSQLGIAWGQGNGNTTDITKSDCEGFYFSNGICGCATLAIAQICAGLKMPASLREYNPNSGTQYYFDWEKIAKHKACTVVWNGVVQEAGLCMELNNDKATIHQSVARLCRIIGNYGHATPEGTQTSMTTDYLKAAAKLVFGSDHVSSDWQELSYDTLLYEGMMMIVIGNPKEEGAGGHAWVCDGCEHVTYIHYDATRNNSFEEWKIISSFRESRCYFHYKWGWESLGNGWYLSLTPDVKTDAGYQNLRFLRVSK